MNDEDLFSKFRKKLMAEAIIKALLFAVVIGAGAAAVAGLITWLVGVNGLWYCVGIFFVAVAVTVPVLYFVKFRPSDVDVARRADALGLEERLITRLELKGEHSFIARKQAEDAVTAYGGLSKKLGFAIPAVAITVAAIVFCVGASTTAVSALSASGYIATFKDVLTDKTSQEYVYENFVSVRYVVVNTDESGSVLLADDGTLEEGDVGFIDGETDQLVEIGGNASPVFADPDVEDENWGFIGWYAVVAGELEQIGADPFRFDENISLDNAVELEDEDYRIVFYYAVYAPLTRGSGDGEGDGDGEGEPGEGEGEGDGDSPDEGEPKDPKDSNGENSGDKDDQQGGSDDEGAGGFYNPDRPENKVINGKIDYQELAEQYAEKAGEELESYDDLPDELKEFIEQYLKTIQ